MIEELHPSLKATVPPAREYTSSFRGLPRRLTLSRLLAGQSHHPLSPPLFWICGAGALVLTSLLCLRLGLNYPTTAFALLGVIAFFALFGSLVASIAFSAGAMACLGYVFVEPTFSFEVSNLHDLAALAAFLLGSLFVTTLIWRVRMLGSLYREQAQLLDLTSDAIIVRDPNDCITFWNRGAEELYGWKRAEALGSIGHRLLGTEFPAPLEDIKQTLLRMGRWEGELVHTTRSGTKVSVLSRWSTDRSEPTFGILESSTDVTQRRLAEEAIRQSEAVYLAEAQQLSNTGSFGWDVVTDELIWSAETFRIFELAPTSIPTVDFVLERIHPDDLDVIRNAFEDAKREGRSFSLEHRLLMPNRTIKFVKVVTRATSNQKGNLEFIGAVMDVSAQKRDHAELQRSELRYRHLFSRMPIALRQLDATQLVRLFKALRQKGVTDLSKYLDENPDFLTTCMDALKFHEANEHAVRLFGGHSSQGQKPSLVRTWQARPDTFRRAMESNFRGDPSFEEETQMVTWDGRVIDVLFITARVGPIDDFEISLVGTIDISERVRAQDALRKLQTDFAHAARVSILGELTASIAHEINQPLAAISTNGGAGLRWLNRPAPDLAEVQLSIQRMVASAALASDIVARIRTMAAGKSTERSLLCLDDVIAEALIFLRHESQSRGVSMAHHRDPSAVEVFGDRVQLQQVVVNLAMNSMQAMEDAQCTDRRITIRTTHSSGRVHFSLVDSGPGIKPEHLDRLFESFFTTKKDGMGMGLPICKSILEAHGGKITAANDDAGEGAKLCFSLATAAE
ncbi:ATP-binding protein [Bradyrhizobium symbiodeficiens]|uniref:ATP-binding protein n=1 Tax=Bradyrhizobium symbiodeficiens TaxID=1404367 RepID=UPI0030D1F6EF